MKRTRIGGVGFWARLGSALVIGATLAVAHRSGAAWVVIDDFSQPVSAAVNTRTGPGSTIVTSTDGTTLSPLTGVIGGIRDRALGCTQNQTTSNLTLSIGAGLLSVTATGQSGPSIYLSYDANPGWTNSQDPGGAPFNGAFGSTVDLTGGGTNAHIAFRFTAIDNFTVGFRDFDITIRSNNTNTTYNVGSLGTGAINTWITANQTAINSGGAVFEMPMSGLTGAGADLTKMQAIQFHACTVNTNLSYTLDYIIATPEPTTGLLFFLTLGCLGLKRRDRTVAC